MSATVQIINLILLLLFSTHLKPVPNLSMSAAIPPLTLYAFMVCIQKTSAF